MKYTKYDHGSYKVHLIKTDKFKTITIRINFRTKIKKEEITIRNFLKAILLDSTENYNTERLLIKEIENLYNLKIYSSSGRTGNLTFLKFTMSFLNPKYTDKITIQDTINFLCDLIFKPNVKHGEFDIDAFNRTKAIVHKTLVLEKDNKTKYGIKRMLETMTDGAPSYNAYGYFDDLNKITPKSLYEYYLKVLANEIVDIIVVGDFDEVEVRNYIKDACKINTFKKDTGEVVLKERLSRKKIKKVIEKEEMKQSKLTVGCNINGLTDFERRYVLPVYNEILGGSSGNSILFDVVREENSLAYYINSIPELYDNMLIIYSGIDKKNLALTLKLIKQAMSKLEKGKFKDEEIDSCKLGIVNAMKISEDSPTSIIKIYYAMESLGSDPIDVRINSINKVTRDDIMKLSKKIKIDTVFLLEGE